VIIDSEIKGDVLFLGYYDSEFDWTNETAKVNVLKLFTRVRCNSSFESFWKWSN